MFVNSDKVKFSLKYLCFYFVPCWVLVAAHRIFVACMSDLVPQLGIDPGMPVLGAESLTHWITREEPPVLLFKINF